MPTARRNFRATPSGNTHGAAEFYTGKNYTGKVLRVDLPTSVSNIGAEFNDAVQSIRLIGPSKAYIYNDEQYCPYVFCVTQSIADLGLHYYDAGASWASTITSFRLEARTYTPPHVTGAAPVTLNDGAAMPIIVQPGSEQFGNCTVDTIVMDIQDRTVYDNFISRFPASKHKAGFEQMSRNVCAILYDNPDQVPNHYTYLTLQFAGTGLASTLKQSATITMGTASTTSANMSSWLTHEVCHLYQYDLHYGSTPYITGTIEGIADYVLVEMGYHTKRPNTAGSNWYDGYDTTAFFFDYIQNRAPVRSPRFIKDLNQSINGNNPAIGNKVWDPAIIRTINAQSKTVDQLWSEYTAWAAGQQ